MQNITRSLVAASLLATAFAANATITINEIRIDQVGTDNDEFFELTGMAGDSLNDLAYIVIGDGTATTKQGVIENVTKLTGLFIPVDGYFLAVEPTFTLGIGNADLVTAANGLNFENSDNVTHMLVRGFTGANAQDLDTNDDGILDFTPWTSIVDWVSVISATGPPTGDYTYSPITVGPDGTFPPSHVYRLPNGSGPWQIGSFDFLDFDTPGSANVPEPGSVAAVLTGFAGLLAIRRRR
jgi:hypothetical protein